VIVIHFDQDTGARELELRSNGKRARVIGTCVRLATDYLFPIDAPLS
jgi:hypothetical protein